MCSSLYSILIANFPKEKADSLFSYFTSLSENAAHSITISKAAAVLGESLEAASRMLNLCRDLGILVTSFALRCPECGMLIYRYKDFSELPDDNFTCYNCQTENEISIDNIEVLYEVESSFFPEGQSAIELSLPMMQIAPSDALSFLLKSGSINSLLFSPSDNEYRELKELYSSVLSPTKTTKAKGDSLEVLCLKLFSLVKIFKCSPIRTKNNQIDLYVRSLVESFLPYLGSRIVIECKNEKRSPDNTYFHKLVGIIRGINGKTSSIVKLGIIVSQKSPTKTIHNLAVIEYASSGLVIISITIKEIDDIINGRKNLLEMIERKHEEIITNAASDLTHTGLFEA